MIGAPGREGGGATFVFARDTSGRWMLQATLTNPGAADPVAWFGGSVALSGNTLVVGAPGHADDQGIAYVYTRSGGTWTLQDALTQSNAAAHDYFGGSVAIVGDTVLVGMPTDSGSRPGAAVLFHRSPTTATWSLLRTLRGPSSAFGFGASVAMSGATALIGAPYAGPHETGSAFVYTRGTSGWQRTASLAGSDTGINDGFGSSVALSGGVAVIGAPFHAGQGEAYVFTGSGSAWSQAAALTGSDTALGDEFGEAVGVSGTTVVVGGPGTGRLDLGTGYVFTPSGSTWLQTGTLVPSYRPKNAWVGSSVAVDAGRVVLGAWPAHGHTGLAYKFWPVG